MTTRRWVMVALGSAAILLVAGRALAGAYADYLWYDALGASALWRTRFAAITELRVGSALVAGLFAFANLYAVRRSVVSLVFPRRVANLEFGEEVPNRHLLAVAVALSVLLGLLLALPADDWMTFVAARWGHTFAQADPYFGQDVGFFVSWLPFENALWTWGFFTVIVMCLVVVTLYALTPSLRWQRGTLYASTYVRRHFTVLVGVVLLFLAWSFRLDMYGLLSAGTGADAAFSWVDHRVVVPGDLLLALVTLGAALIALWCGFVGQLRLASVSVLSVIVLALLVREVAPLAAAHAGNDVTRLARERPYLDTRGAYTRRAFGIEALPRMDSSAAYQTLAAARPWIPAWDPPALARAIDESRPSDESARTAWRVTPDGLDAVVVKAPPPTTAGGTWSTTYVLATAADDRGAPVYAPDAPPSSETDAVADPPLVYPGAPPYAVIPDSLNHAAGTLLESFITRLAYAWSLQNFHILSGDLVQPKPTLLVHRDVRDRVARLVPFFTEGSDVHPVLAGDALYWSIDLYATSDDYPLSQRLPLAGEDRGYARHAATAIVQASTGDMVVVPDSTLDPVADTWVRHLPSIFSNWSSLPAGVRAQLAPPTDGIEAQAAAFGRYGSGGDTTVVRHVSELTGADGQLQSDNVPLVLPGGRSTAVALPLVDESDRIRGLFIGVGGATRTVAWYPLAGAGPRWGAVLDRLRAVDSTVRPAADGSLGSAGSLARGRVRVVPIKSGVAFVQPVYRMHPQGAPALDHLTTLANDTARAVQPPAGAPEPRPGAAPHGTTAAPTAAALYDQMRDALHRGDWAAFGRAFDALGKILAGSTR